MSCLMVVFQYKGLAYRVWVDMYSRFHIEPKIVFPPIPWSTTKLEPDILAFRLDLKKINFWVRPKRGSRFKLMFGMS